MAEWLGESPQDFIQWFESPADLREAFNFERFFYLL